MCRCREGPPFFRFSDERATRTTLEQTGFGDIQVHELPLVWRLKSAGDAFDALSRGGVPHGRKSCVRRHPKRSTRSGPPSALAVEAYAQGGEFVIPMPAVTGVWD